MRLRTVIKNTHGNYIDTPFSTAILEQMQKGGDIIVCGKKIQVVEEKEAEIEDERVWLIVVEIGEENER